jgi:hypothetical protein
VGVERALIPYISISTLEFNLSHILPYSMDMALALGHMDGKAESEPKGGREM